MRTTQIFPSSLGKTGTAAALGLALAIIAPSCDNPKLELPGDPLLESQQERGPGYGINHDGVIDDIGDVFKDGRQVSPAVGEKLHSCGKLRFNRVGLPMPRLTFVRARMTSSGSPVHSTA